MPIAIPWLLTLAAAVVYFVLGAVWYGYFGEQWMRELGKRKEQLQTNDPTPFVIAFLSSLLNAIAVALVLNWVIPLTETRLLAAFVTALLLGGAVVAAALAKHYAFAHWSWRLFAIDTGYDLVGFLLMSLLLAFMR
ncbi:MAG TPA: DUF1761 domain-containing protein [Gemmatales bacterium]|nr:DUF1761 domain-containing protein [Gemmatales bacterium]HMP18513.1 DUF1761 domain-containing protein [Gemmatales bacterium]